MLFDIIKNNIFELEDTINEACYRSKRTRDSVNLLVVSKYRSFDELKIVSQLGYKNMAENRVEALLERVNEFSVKDDKINWHLIGTIQRRKVKSIIDNVESIHSVDSIKLAEEIDKRFQSNDIKKRMKVFLQVNCSKESQKHGFAVEEIVESYFQIKELKNIEIIGLMTMAENTSDKNKLRKTFELCRSLKERIDAKISKKDRIIFKELSMGMSSDFVEAIEEGSTIIRIGSKIFDNNS